MEIKIERNGTTFKIFRKDNFKNLFCGTWWMKFGQSKGEIHDENNNIIYKIAKRIDFLKFKMYFEIESSKKLKLKLVPKNRKHSIFVLKILNESFTVKLHRGRTKSIFKNGCQVAFIEEPILTYLNQELIKIKADYDVDLEIIFLLTFCLEIDNYDDDNGVTLNLGNLIKMEPENTNWEPKNKHEA